MDYIRKHRKVFQVVFIIATVALLLTSFAPLFIIGL